MQVFTFDIYPLQGNVDGEYKNLTFSAYYMFLFDDDIVVICKCMYVYGK